jgi:hypothetical protein
VPVAVLIPAVTVPGCILYTAGFSVVSWNSAPVAIEWRTPANTTFGTVLMVALTVAALLVRDRPYPYRSEFWWTMEHLWINPSAYLALGGFALGAVIAARVHGLSYVRADPIRRPGRSHLPRAGRGGHEQ